ncbi:hypothetical protein AVEN_91540-1 [Araneus ventricosus]|uniref:Uncharacterized protein n=1 Tax=Araneus ventricosus TaxID=182803 RepID=A0A4Y2BKR8_ARAVE|nr:hypothetical protein AVEN_91540-1 [Araneus ventricosus]
MLIFPSDINISPFPTLSNKSAKRVLSSEDKRTRILVLSANIVNSCEMHKLLREAFNLSALVPLVTTGKIWRKSPENKTVQPPIGELVLLRSRIILSNASSEVLCDNITSSLTINEQFLNNLAVLLCFEMLRTLISSLQTFNGSLNVACAVLPPSKSVAVIPEDATAKGDFEISRKSLK